MRHLFLSVILLTTFLSAMPVDAGKFTVQSEGFIYEHDSEAKTLRISSKSFDNTIPNIRASWENNIAALTTKVTFQADGYIFKKEIDGLSLVPQKLEEKFTAGRVEYDGFTHYFKKQGYERPDGTVLERILEEYWEKIATETKLIINGEVCISKNKPEKMYYRGKLVEKEKHTIDSADLVEKSQVILRKLSPDGTPKEVNRSSSGKFVELIRRTGYPYFSHTLPGTPCAADPDKTTNQNEKLTCLGAVGDHGCRKLYEVFQREKIKAQYEVEEGDE